MKATVPHLVLLPAVVLVLTLPRTWAANADLAQFSPESLSQRVIATDATAELKQLDSAAVLHVTTGTNQPWPGITLKPPGKAWDLSANAEVALRIKNVGSASATVYCRVDNPGADGQSHCVTASITLGPGADSILHVPLKRTKDDRMGGKLFGMRGYPVTDQGIAGVDPGNITQLLVFVTKPASPLTFEIHEVRATGTYVSPTAWTRDAAPLFPFIDTFGQYRHKSWPGKVLSQVDLVARRAHEAADLDAHPAPQGWSTFGGSLTLPKTKATGFFRTEKFKGKWWLVDPKGHLFFSHGIDCVGMLDTTPVEDRESWFHDFPAAQPGLDRFLSKAYALKGHYADRTVQWFSFAGANLARKYGANWHTAYAELAHRRLRSWGFNTIANWSDQSIAQLRRTPYTDTIGSRTVRAIEGSEGYWAKFPDVFDPSFESTLRQAMEAKKGRSAGDPWCIGFFSDNEMSWGDEFSLATAALNSPADQPAKREFLKDLEARYGSIDELNRAWSTSFPGWEDLRQSRKTPAIPNARADLGAFYSKAAERYFKTVRDAIKAEAPNQLYLGCRFAWGNARAAAAAAKYCDIVSYNLYQRSVADFKFNGGVDVPLIIGEFHFGALDRGLFHTGLVPVANQAARAQAYRDYVLDVLKHPQFVGCHWFQFQDEPTTGRVYDEENYQIGFVDIADTPYPEMLQVTRELSNVMYER